MIVTLKTIEAMDNGAARITFGTEQEDFSFIIPRVHASRVCKTIVDFAFDCFQKVITLDKPIWERTGKESLLFTCAYQDGTTKELQIVNYIKEGE